MEECLRNKYCFGGCHEEKWNKINRGKTKGGGGERCMVVVSMATNTSLSPFLCSLENLTSLFTSSFSFLCLLQHSGKIFHFIYCFFISNKMCRQFCWGILFCFLLVLSYLKNEASETLTLSFFLISGHTDQTYY